MELLEIDGALGEGGGAILRLSAGFSLLFNRSIRIKNIRANRPKPGLRLQHLMGLKALSELTSSTLSECHVGTKEITIHPNKLIKSNIKVEVGTAGNIGLLLQPVQIACMGFNKPEKIEILVNGGGTFGMYAPSLNYLKEVTYSFFKKVGLNIRIEIKKHGFYPKGGAHVKCIIKPPQKKLKAIYLTELGNIDLIQGEIIITNQLMGRNIGKRIQNTILQLLKKQFNIDVEIKVIGVDSLSSGLGLSLWAYSNTGAIISSGTILGEKKITSENLGKIAANKLINYIKNDIPIDNYLSDQIIPLMAYASFDEPSKIKVLEITNHTKTNLELTKLFVDKNYKITREKNHYIIEF
ncbi:hypothetical protein LCGC14_1027940 [marine sediment metagenome]|uniref:RNA 3'-terminal phosphate cyclase domain-containing protein n=1 Tax=marine sediment metagenome TaxID=412755 RepID=A0A0F9MVJ5_9ZZZZ